MAQKREMPGLADMIATVISPALIMAMVGSLIFFLIEVLYGGEYSGRLRWTFFFFTFASVLVARIAIEMGDGKASLYAAALGGAAFLAMLRFVDYPDGFMGQFGWLINIGLLVLVWWCARQLTWDCTFVDEKRDASDHSLLEAAGIDALERPPEWREPEPVVEKKPRKKLRVVGVWERYQEYRKAQDAKPHTPGVWVVYFSLAALPIFGLGQSLIPSEETESRQFTFWLAAIYVGSGLGLLMTTSFLGLRRYLKQKKLQIPAKMASIWLGLGTGLILLFLTVAAVLPRPSSETPLINISGVGSKERDASDYAMKDDGQGKGDGARGDQKSEQSQSNQSTDGKSQEAGKGKGSDDASKGSGQDKGKGGDSGKSDQSGNQKGGEKGDGSKGGKGNEKNNDGKKTDENSKDGSRPGSKSKNDSGGKSKSSSGGKSRSSKGPSSLGSLGQMANVLKWIVFSILALVVAYFAFKHGLKFLANFSDWAKNLLASIRNFWANLFGRSDVEKTEAEVESTPFEPRAQPFADFANPFETGAAQQQSPADLVKYSFAALEAFAWEHERERTKDETPIEFADRIASGSPELETYAPRLATLYARLAYARGKLPDACREQVKEFWRQLELAHEESLTERKAEAAQA